MVVPGTLCHAMSRPHHLCQFPVATSRLTFRVFILLTFIAPVKWLCHYWHFSPSSCSPVFTR